jgi:aminoglycoside/choline kinase family phosphotransferase
VVDLLNPAARQFLNATPWCSAACQRLTGDASVRKYFRLRQGHQTVVLMDASAIPQTVGPFIQIDRHLRRLGLSAPEIFIEDKTNGFLVVEDFGDDTFARLCDRQSEPQSLFALATDLLMFLHQQDRAVPEGLRTYHPDRMLADLELFLEWCTPDASEVAKSDFRATWRDVLPLAHRVPASLLLRDHHVANLMLLTEREGIRRAGLLDFQDAYAGPVTYDLMSLLQDARRDVPAVIRRDMVTRYLAGFPALDPELFHISLNILAALRHTRVLGIFERLSRFEGKHEYKQLHSPRVQSLLQSALRHPTLSGVKRWMEQHAW